MKKIIMIMMLVLGIVGCSCNKTIKVTIDYAPKASQDISSSYLYDRYSLLSDELETTGEYDAKIENKDSFLMFVYADGCYGCSLLAPALKEYVNENNLLIYTINKAVISDKHDLYKAGINTTPFLVLVEKGTIKYIELMKLENEADKNINTVKNWMNEHIEWSEN